MDHVVERKVLRPDPGLIKSLGSHHDLKSAIADLVDNSIDAGARRILIRFETDGDRPVGLTLVDDGRGMDGGQIDEAMRVGASRQYEKDAHGHFGIGLKSASFSHANTLTVHTAPRRGEYHGRRLVKADVQRDYSCDVLSPKFVRTEVNGLLHLLDTEIGTVVRWSDTDFPASSGLDRGNWLEDSRTQLRIHLGIIYHRLMQAGRLHLEIEIHDVAAGISGAPEIVAPIDPLGFSATAVAGYPMTAIASVGAARIELECHIVPPRSSQPAFRLYGRDGSEFQGFYIYRNDRLMQVGGWNLVTGNDKNRTLARVAIRGFEALGPHVRMNPEKSGIVFSHELRMSIAEAVAGGRRDGRSFRVYLERAEEVLAESRRRRHGRKPVVQPGKGLHEDVRRVIRAEIPIRKDEDPVEIRWRRMSTDRFIDLDRENRVILSGERQGLFNPCEMG